MSWGAVLGGAVVAMGIWVLLYALGLAIGLSSLDPMDLGTAKSSGIATGIWSLIAPLIALFVGGFVAGRTGGVLDRFGGALHGAVTWGLVTLVGVFFVGSTMAAIVRGATDIGRGAAGAVFGSAEQAGEALGIDMSTLVGPINEKLREQGHPPVTAAQLRAATRDAAQSAVREGELNRDTLVRSIAERTALSRRDANEVAGQIEEAWRKNVAPQAGRVQRGALEVAENVGTVFWGVFFALLLGMIAAVVGGMLGVTRGQRAAAHEPVSVMTRPQEVYP